MSDIKKTTTVSTLWKILFFLILSLVIIASIFIECSIIYSGVNIQKEWVDILIKIIMLIISLILISSIFIKYEEFKISTLIINASKWGLILVPTYFLFLEVNLSNTYSTILFWMVIAIWIIYTSNLSIRLRDETEIKFNKIIIYLMSFTYMVSLAIFASNTLFSSWTINKVEIFKNISNIKHILFLVALIGVLFYNVIKVVVAFGIINKVKQGGKDFDLLSINRINYFINNRARKFIKSKNPIFDLSNVFVIGFVLFVSFFWEFIISFCKYSLLILPSLLTIGSLILICFAIESKTSGIIEYVGSLTFNESIKLFHKILIPSAILLGSVIMIYLVDYISFLRFWNSRLVFKTLFVSIFITFLIFSCSGLISWLILSNMSSVQLGIIFSISLLGAVIAFVFVLINLFKGKISEE